MILEEIFLQIRPEDIAYVKFIFESYEGVGIVRTADRKKAIIALLVTPGFKETAYAVVDSLKDEVMLTEVARPQDITADWLLTEMAKEP